MAVGLGVIAFVTVVAFRSQPADPQTRLPSRYRLADLIEQQQSATADLRRQVTELRREVDRQRAASASRVGGASARQASLREAGLTAGLTALRGPAIKVTLDDSDLDEPPEGATVNDLVVHSQDVQAVVNALWRAGAEAMSINGQRLVSTSAVLCVGNTLLLNGTVHSPPYVVTAIGANRDRFDADRLVRRLRSSASTFGLRFAVDRDASAEVPAYRGSLTLNYARPAA
jgi:uncharacterized protein YlxW (UPF0749 family)